MVVAVLNVRMFHQNEQMQREIELMALSKEFSGP